MNGNMKLEQYSTELAFNSNLPNLKENGRLEFIFYITTGNHRNNLELYKTTSKSKCFLPKLTKTVKTSSLFSKLNVRHFERIFFRLLPKKGMTAHVFLRHCALANFFSSMFCALLLVDKEPLAHVIRQS